MISGYFIVLFLINYFYVASVSQSDFGSGFALFPASSNWKVLVKGMKAKHITEGVQVYMAPFKEYQAAARDLRIKLDELKLAVITAISLLQESARNFAISAEDFNAAKEDIDPFLVMSNAVFKLKKIEKLDSVFSVESLETFSRLRLKHLVAAENTSYITFLMNKNSYESTLQEWNVIASRLPKCQYRSLMSRNIDLCYVEHMTALYLNVMRLRSKGDKVEAKLPRIIRYLQNFRQDKLIAKIAALGNGYSTSKPPYSGFLIAVCTFYAILFTVLF